MSSAPQFPLKTHRIPTKMDIQNGSTAPESRSRHSSPQNAGDEPMAKSASLAIREATDRGPVLSEPAPIKASQCVSEMGDLEQAETGVNGVSENKPPGLEKLEYFDWNSFEARYNKAMIQANEAEMALLNEFEDTAQYFSLWTASASRRDEDRAMKRLKTRETYIQKAERSLEEKRDHYFQVVDAFRKALELLVNH